MSRSRSWRDVLPIHPAAELFPLMSPDELRALGEDIKANGLTSPISIKSAKDARWQYWLLDGRNRLDAMEMVGIPARLELINGQCSVIMDADTDHAFSDANVIEGDPVAYVISANIHRRHLTAEQKRESIGKLIKALPEKSDRQIAALLGVSHHTVGAVRTEMEGRGQIAHVSTRIDTQGREQPARKTTTKPPPVSAEVLQQRAAAAERIRGLMGGNKVRDDIGSESAGECVRLRARIEELQTQLTHFESQNIALRSEVGELKADKLACLEELEPVARRLEIENVELRSEVEDLRSENAGLREALDEARGRAFALLRRAAPVIAPERSQSR